ncbi:MAG: hypothetical protein ABSE16_18975 [Verrucomicrobiota bacterium]|jgi:hypothetical protein
MPHKINRIRKYGDHVKRSVAILCAVVLFSALAWKAGATQEGNTIYDPNPRHLWNRLNEAVFVRTAPDGKKYGLDELDILYWARTTNLLAGASHERALAVLDEFIQTHGEKLIQDPLEKALLQRDFWELFDWSAMGFGYANNVVGRRELQRRLAVVIRKLGLTTNEIASLPDNYAQAETAAMPDLPQGLFQTNSDWINVSVNTYEQTVPAHTLSFGGRSVFTVWFHDSDGRRAGLDYLEQLRAFKPMWVPTANFPWNNMMTLNTNLPEFPAQSQWALARCLCVVDADGRIQPTHLVESIQLRTYLDVHGFADRRRPGNSPAQQFNEFDMSRRSHAELVSIPEDQKDFTNVRLFSRGIDFFEPYQPGPTNYDSANGQSLVLENCVACHSGRGIFSVNSFTRFGSVQPTDEATQLIEAEPKREERMALDWKQERFDWGLLQGLWIPK